MEGRIADTSVEPLIVTDPADLLRPELRNVVMYETDTDAEAFGVGALGEDMMGELPENEGVVPPFAPQPSNFKFPRRTLDAHAEEPFTFANIPAAPQEKPIAPQKEAFGVGALELHSSDFDSSDEDDILFPKPKPKPPKKPEPPKPKPKPKPQGRKHPRRIRAKQKGYRPVVRPRRVILGGKAGNPTRAQAPRVQRGMARNPIMSQIDNEANYYYQQSFVPRYKKDDMAVMYPWLFGEEGLYSEIECEWPCRTINGKCVCPD